MICQAYNNKCQKTMLNYACVDSRFINLNQTSIHNWFIYILHT